MCRALLLAALLLLLKLPFENSAWNREISLRGYDAVQSALRVSERSAPLPVCVVDISRLPSVAENPFVPDVKATSRPALLAVLRAVTRERPVAVGVDIDFAPDDTLGGFVTPGDPAFFAACAALSRETGVPIYLGVARTAALSPESWLGDSVYAPLAASLVVPRQNTRLMLRFTQSNLSAVPCKTLSATLADRYKARERGRAEPVSVPVPAGLAWAATLRAEQIVSPALREEHFAVDYAPLTRLRKTVVPAASVSGSNTLRGRVVILGDVALPVVSDRFAVGSGDRSVPGCLLHACAVYTLIAAPLYDLTGAGRAVLDIGLGVSVLVAIAAVRLLRVRANAPAREDARHADRLEKRGLVAVAVFALLFGVVFVGATRVLWDDFLVVIIGLFADKPLEAALTHVWQRLRRKNEVSPPEAMSISAEVKSNTDGA